MLGKTYVIEMQKQYKKIDGEWLMLQYKTSIVLVLFSFLAECILGAMLCHWDEIHTSVTNYILKYIIAPFFLNVVCLVIGFIAMKSNLLTQKRKTYFILLEYVALGFILYTVHSIYSSLCFIFAIPIALTVVYGDYLLTTIIAVCSIGSYIISELFIVWDPYKIDIRKDRMMFVNFMVYICILIAFLIVCIVLIRFEKEKNMAIIKKETEQQELQQRLFVDELTKIYNRAALEEAFCEIDQDESDTTYIFVMIDLDNFKMLNDTLGHPIGDQCLTDFGEILKLHCNHGTPYRFGGDEFSVLFFNQTLEHVIDSCKKIQRDFDGYIHKNKINVPLSASFGIAHYTKNMSPMKLLSNSDQALYKAKDVKNTIHIYKDNLVNMEA